MKMTLQNLKCGVIYGVCALFTFACSPVAPSVSKVSNTASNKSTPTSSSEPGSDVVSNSAGLSNPTSAQSEFTGDQRTVVISLAKIKEAFASSNKKKYFELTTEEFSELLSNLKTKDYSLNFEIDKSSIVGREISLMGKKTTVYLVVDCSEEKIKRLTLGEAQTKLTWKPVSLLNEKAHWSLSLTEPNMYGEYADANANSERLLNNLSSRLVSVIIEFNSNY